MHSDTHVYNTVVTVSSTLRTSFAECIAERGKTHRPIRYSVFRHARALQALSPFNRVGLRLPRFPTTMLSLSCINLPNISISGLINPRSENIVQILVATFTLLALLPRSFYFQSIIRDRLNLRLADPQVYDFPFSILSIIPLQNSV